MPRRCIARALFACLLLACPLSSCTCKQKTDAERAAEERAKVDEMLRSSLSLLPYRIGKALERSRGQANRPEIFAKFEEAWAKVTGPTASPKEYLDLSLAIYRARETLKDRDEDEFPTMYEVVHGSLPFPGYDSGMEHAACALKIAVTPPPQIQAVNQGGMKRISRQQAVLIRALAGLCRDFVLVLLVHLHVGVGHARVLGGVAQ